MSDTAMNGRWSRGRWIELALAGGALAGAAALTVVLALSRRATRVVQFEIDGKYALAGSGETFVAIASGLRLMPVFAVVGTVVAAALVCTRTRRRDAAVALVILVGANTSVQAFEVGLAHRVPTALSTVPSGHVCLGISAGCAMALLAPPRRRRAGTFLGGACAAFATVGVTAAYWHVPGDVVASLVWVAAWVMVARAVVGSRIFPGRRDVTSVDAGVALLGAIWVLVTLTGWGSAVKLHQSLVHLVVGLVCFVVLPLVAALLVAVSGRALRTPEGPTD